VPSNCEPQPCSSKQALERDRGLNLMTTNKKPIQSANPCYIVPDDGIDLSDPFLRCNEEIFEDEKVIIHHATPPSLSSPIHVRNSSSGKHSDRKEKLTPRSSKKRLDFGESQEKETEDQHTLDWKEFWAKDDLFKKPLIDFQPVVPPALNGTTDIDDVRNQIRSGIEAVNEPLDEDVECLKKYFSELISRGWLQQSRSLLRFLDRYALENLNLY